MKIKFKIEDGWELDDEICEITITGDIFDVREEDKDNKYLLSIAKNVARLRGHKTKYISVKILDIKK